MAKSKSAGGSTKVSFGKRRIGKYKKSNGPKEAPTKKSRGQG
jgi:hypothetical protein